MAAKKTDIRRIYAKSLKVLDTTELERALKDLDTERQERKKAEINASEMKIQYQMVNKELEAYKKKVKEMEEKLKLGYAGGTGMGSSLLSSSVLDVTTGEMGANFVLDKTIDISIVIRH